MKNLVLQVEKGPGSWDKIASYKEGKIVTFTFKLWQFSRELKITGRVIGMSKNFTPVADAFVRPLEGCENLRFIVKDGGGVIQSSRVLTIGGGKIATLEEDSLQRGNLSVREYINQKIIDYFGGAPSASEKVIRKFKEK